MLLESTLKGCVHVSSVYDVEEEKEDPFEPPVLVNRARELSENHNPSGGCDRRESY